MTKRLYMYDVRGIQDYIFRTNKIKEIIGASEKVRGITRDLFIEVAERLGKVIIKPNGELKFNFNEPNDFDAEIFYEGGGNLLVLYDDDTVAKEINKTMRIQLVKETYSLQLAIAGIDVESNDSYINDYEKLRKEMDKVKLNMPPLSPISSFPFTLNDPITGFPLSEYHNQKVTRETKSKLMKYEDVQKGKAENINEMGSEVGDSMVAIVHIDGNEMGKKVQEKMSNVTTYREAAKVMREFSSKVDQVFKDYALESVISKLPEFWAKVGIDNEKNNKQLFRTIIHAGDDITFVCNAKIALQCVREFMRCIEKQGEFKASGGIYVMHSHFPFSRGYELCEQLCASAKSIDRDHNYVDFHLSYGGVLNDIETIREKQYVSKDNQKLLARPYQTNKENDQLLEFMKLTKKLENDNIPRSKLKSLREAFYAGKAIVDREVKMINSRLPEGKRIILNTESDIMDESYRRLFDAIEMMDLKWGEINE